MSEHDDYIKRVLELIDKEYEEIRGNVKYSLFCGMPIDADDMKQLVCASYHSGLADGIAREREWMDRL